MTIKEKLEKLGSETNTPCVSISLNTHRTHPDNAQDAIELKNLLKEAEERVINEYGKRPAASVLEKISIIEKEININYNLDSLHIYLSNDTQEIIRSTWPTTEAGVHVSDRFAVRPLIKSFNRSEEYYILLLSQSGAHMYETLNDGIIGEIQSEDFPFPETRHYNTHSDKGSDSKHVDDLVREFLNKVDKAVVKIHNITGLHCVVICTEDNYSRLNQVADKPSVYYGYANIDYNNTATHHIAKQAWEIVKELQFKRRTEAISEMREAVAQGKVLTDLQEIFQASIDGRGDLLIVHQDFSQAVSMLNERTFELASDTTQPDVIDDISSTISWEVLSKKGRVMFTSQEEINDLGNIALKTRY
jgi:hypothetical protein